MMPVFILLSLEDTPTSVMLFSRPLFSHSHAIIFISHLISVPLSYCSISLYHLKSSIVTSYFTLTSLLFFTLFFSVPSEKEREGDKVEKDSERTETRLRKEINMETLKKLTKLILMKDKYSDVRTCTRTFIRVD